MIRFIAVYEGPSIAEARLVAVTSDPETLSAISSHLLDNKEPQRREKVEKRKGQSK